MAAGEDEQFLSAESSSQIGWFFLTEKNIERLSLFLQFIKNMLVLFSRSRRHVDRNSILGRADA